MPGCSPARTTSANWAPDRGLFAYKALSRTADRDRARRALDFIGLDGRDDDLLRLVTTNLSPVGIAERAGEILLTGPRQNTGRIKVHIPALPRIADHIRTTPSTARAPRQPRPGSGTRGPHDEPACGTTGVCRRLRRARHRGGTAITAICS
ncbi:hypothetical protein [Streptomyces sp. KL116D]|uniref:hypothetical protein n=1 Tax=Streptomyces sp. KL116D TaxID=3045152 RepID=UPI0035577728